ncbi:MAG: hypothetical protein RLZZ09_2661, partial [Pseudomonadota bacterium]
MTAFSKFKALFFSCLALSGCYSGYYLTAAEKDSV